MKNIFRGYYRPSEREFSELWQSATIVLDANVLLNMYRYTNETRDRLISILREFGDRLWLPHQAAYEFHKNRLKVICDQQDAYAKVDEILKTHKKEILGQLGEFKRHPFIRIDGLVKSCDRGIDAAIKVIEEQKLKHPSLPDQDKILASITELFDGKVGVPYEADILNNIYKEGEYRYSIQIPPGFKDATIKQGNDRFGDLVLWFQLIAYAKEKKQPVILVTDDVKDDWWVRLKGKTIGPRPELVEEFHIKTSVSFYMYKTDQFMEFSNHFSKKNVSTAMLDEVREIRTQAVMRALLDSDKFMVKGTDRDRLVSIYGDLVSQKISIETEIAKLTNALDSKLDSIEDSEIACKHRDKLIFNLRDLEKEISAVSTSIAMKNDSISDESYWKHLSETLDLSDKRADDVRRLWMFKKFMQDKSSKSE